MSGCVCMYACMLNTKKPSYNIACGPHHTSTIIVASCCTSVTQDPTLHMGSVYAGWLQKRDKTEPNCCTVCLHFRTQTADFQHNNLNCFRNGRVIRKLQYFNDQYCLKIYQLSSFLNVEKQNKILIHLTWGQLTCDTKVWFYLQIVPHFTAHESVSFATLLSIKKKNAPEELQKKQLQLIILAQMMPF